MKFPHPASRFAVVGVAAVLSVDGGKVGKASVAVTGAGTKAVRAKGVEAAITGKAADAASIQAAAEKAAEGVDVQADLQGTVEYKSHLVPGLRQAGDGGGRRGREVSRSVRRPVDSPAG